MILPLFPMYFSDERLEYRTFRSNTGSVSGSLSPTTTGVSGFIIPAFSKAISGNVFPSMSQWSSPMLVITLNTGEMMFVLSSLPPRPVSTTATSTFCPANQSNAIEVVISKKERSR